MTMFLVGGGPGEGLDRVHDQFVEAARKRGTRVVLALLGSQDEAEQFLPGYAEPISQRWPEAVIVPVWLDDEPGEANSTEWPQDLSEAAGLVVAGGWTPGYLEALRPQRSVIATLVRRGVPYLGYSAGAMVVGKQAIVGGWKFRGRRIVPELWGEGIEELELREGLGLIGPTVDVHTDVSGLGQGMAAMEKGVGSVVAIDEETCLVVDPASGQTVVEGNHRVHWLARDGRAVVVNHDLSANELGRHRQAEAAEKEQAERMAAEAAEQARVAAEERAEREQAEREAEQARAAQEAAERVDARTAEPFQTELAPVQPPLALAAPETVGEPEPVAEPEPVDEPVEATSTEQPAAEPVTEAEPVEATSIEQPAAEPVTEAEPVEAASTERDLVAEPVEATSTEQPTAEPVTEAEPVEATSTEPEAPATDRSAALDAALRAADEAAALEQEPAYGELPAVEDIDLTSPDASSTADPDASPEPDDQLPAEAHHVDD